MADLLYESQYFTTTLSVAGGINASQTTGIVLQNVSGVSEPTKPGLCLLSYSDPLDTTKAEWITYRSVNTTTKELVGVTRGQEGSSGKPHSNGVVVAFPHSKSHINRINDKLTGVDTGVSLNQPTIATPIVKTAYSNGLGGVAKTIDWSKGDLQTITLDENITINFSNAAAGQRLTLFLLQDSSGGNTITWTPTITWQDNITWGDTYYTKTANKMNVVVIYYSGSAYFGMVAKFA